MAGLFLGKQARHDRALQASRDNSARGANRMRQLEFMAVVLDTNSGTRVVFPCVASERGAKLQATRALKERESGCQAQVFRRNGVLLAYKASKRSPWISAKL